ncbi:hypothetical protein VZT92_024139 [Zoarces viviparus]|uniref:Uncharacterized protein n=1 Tax=Zoarces viviparus TaxID=48416 RepID=A0AAW1E1B2_ZOAVI
MVPNEEKRMLAPRDKEMPFQLYVSDRRYHDEDPKAHLWGQIGRPAGHRLLLVSFCFYRRHRCLAEASSRSSFDKIIDTKDEAPVGWR